MVPCKGFTSPENIKIEKETSVMKIWNQPSLEELDLSATAYSEKKGSVVDGSYVSGDGKYEIPTYGPSGEDTI